MQVTIDLDEQQTKDMFKQALTEMIQARDQTLLDMVADVLEDLALGHAIEEGEKSKPASREEVFEILEGSA